MSLESRLFRHLRKFVFEQDEAEVRAIIRREVRAAVRLEFNPHRRRVYLENAWRGPRSENYYLRMLGEVLRPEITGAWLDEFAQATPEQQARVKEAFAPKVHTSGYAVLADEKRPPITLGNWDELWARAEAEDAAKDKK